MLKNETNINKEQDCNINTEEATTLKNKVNCWNLKINFWKTTLLTTKYSLTQYYNTIQNSVKTLMLAVLSLLQTRQESKKTTTWKATLQKKKMLSWIIDKNKKKITKIFKILGDSMVKYIKDKNHNVYVRSFSGAKVKCMKDYVKPSIREKKSGLRYFPWWNKWANSELPPKRIVKSIIDVAKNTLSDNRIFSMSGILPRNDSFNIKVMVVNKELSKMCEKEKLIFWVLITSTRKPIWIKANFSS